MFILASGGSIMEALEIVPKTILVTIVGFLLLFLLLKKFLWLPLAAFLDSRKEDIQQTYDKVDETRRNMESLKADYEQRLTNIEAEARAQTQAAVQEAQAMRETILAEARQQAEKILSDTRQTLQFDREQMMAQLKAQVVDITIQATEKLLNHKVDDASDRELVADFIEQVAKN
ncbi:MAG: F0F1 ATP synthase subunit B [Armatimonadota bacterium]